MKTYSLLIFALVLGLSTHTYAAQGSWQDQFRGYTIYYDGGYATSYFTPNANVPNYGASIEQVSWQWYHYNNGHTKQTVKLCYRKPYQYYNYRCKDISDHQSGSIHLFDGLDAKGSFIIKIKLDGGYYPAYPGSKPEDVVHVEYSY